MVFLTAGVAAPLIWKLYNGMAPYFGWPPLSEPNNPSPNPLNPPGQPRQYLLQFNDPNSPPYDPNNPGYDPNYPHPLGPWEPGYPYTIGGNPLIEH